MTPKELLFSPHGRIGRAEFLLGACALVGASIVFERILIMVPAITMRLITLGVQDAGLVLSSIMLGFPSLVQQYFGIAYVLACLLPLYRLVVKRCRDRERDSKFAVIFVIALLVPIILFSPAGRFIFSVTGLGPRELLGNNYIKLTFLCLWVWAFVELVFLGASKRDVREAQP
jgi:uncharacterized membrane protein YhaH (DUF805 family)